MARPRKKTMSCHLQERTGRVYLAWGRAPARVLVSLEPILDGAAPKARAVLADRMRREVDHAMAGGPWPAWAKKIKAVQRYLTRTAGGPVVGGDRLDEYKCHLAVSNRNAGWIRNSLKTLTALRDFSGALETVTPEKAQAWIDHLGRDGGARGALSAKSIHLMRGQARRYYYWLRGDLPELNPFARKNVKLPAVRHHGRITHLTQAERKRVLNAAKNTAHGTAIWIANYCGLRKEEIRRVEWDDFNWRSLTLYVRPGKTNSARTVPVHRSLAAFLRQAVQAKARAGRIVRWRETDGEWQYDADLTIAALQDALPDMAEKLNGWNIFRHTVGSHLAQHGLSLSKIAAILGNTEAVCKKNYAEFVRDRDEDILLLD